MNEDQRTRRWDGGFVLGPWPDAPTEVALDAVGGVEVALEDEFVWSEDGTVHPACGLTYGPWSRHAGSGPWEAT